MAQNQSTADNSIPAYPTSITLGGIEYKVSEVPELKQFLTDVGAVERRKLNSTIQGLKKGIDDLQNVNVTNSVDTEAIAASAAKSVMDGLSPILKTITDYVLTEQKETVESYRDNLLKSLGDSVIPDLVTGKTKEELDASVEHAKNIRAKYAPVNAPASAPVTVTPVAVVETPAGPAVAVAPAANQRPDNVALPREIPGTGNQPQLAVASVPVVADDQYQGADIKNMNMDDYAKNRASLAETMKSLMGQ